MTRKRKTLPKDFEELLEKGRTCPSHPFAMRPASVGDEGPTGVLSAGGIPWRMP